MVNWLCAQPIIQPDLRMELARFSFRSSWVVPVLGKSPAGIIKQVIEMPRNIYIVLYILVMIAVVVSVDLLFFKNRFWERLIVNIGIVLVFAAFYLRFLKKP